MRERLAAIPGWAALGGLVVLSTLLRFWAGTRVPTPWIVPDEVVYAELGRSLYRSDSFEILGEPARFYGLVYPALVGLPLSIGDLAAGYTLLKAIQALVMSLAAVPVYVWGRSLMSGRWALAAAALTLAVPGLAYSGLVMTEVAFYPVSALAAWSMAHALARPSLGNQALAVAAIVLASATRLQAAVLAPAFVTAALLVAACERSPRRAVALWPAFAGLVAAGGGWAAWRLSGGGPASELFGAYRAAGEVGYTVSDAVLYARWHAADVLLMTGVVPACAIAVLLWNALAGRERSPEARAYLAVATALTAWLVVEVGVFASRHVGRLAERDLLAISPVLFLGLALWLDRGAPRPRLPTALAAAAALGLVLSLPVGKLVSLAAIPDAFTLIPLYRVQVRAPSVDLQLLVDLLAAAAVAAFALVPSRWRLALPLAIGVFLAAVSLSASRVVAAEAKLTQLATLGDDRRWIDEAADGPVTYLYSGEAYAASVWESVFWNRQLTRVYALLAARVPGLTDTQQPSVGPLPDGRLVLRRYRPARADYVVAPAALGLVGEQVAYAFSPALVLWRARPPLRLSTWVQRAGENGPARVLVYDCRAGRLRLRLLSPVAQRVELTRDGRRLRAVSLRPGEHRTAALPAPRAARTGICAFGVEPQSPVTIDRVEFVRG